MRRNPLKEHSAEHEVAGIDARIVAVSYNTGSNSFSPPWNILLTTSTTVFTQGLEFSTTSMEFSCMLFSKKVSVHTIKI